MRDTSSDLGRFHELENQKTDLRLDAERKLPWIHIQHPEPKWSSGTQWLVSLHTSLKAEITKLSCWIISPGNRVRSSCGLLRRVLMFETFPHFLVATMICQQLPISYLVL